MNNLHISLNELTNASRVLKQTSSLARSGHFNHIYIAGLHLGDLKKEEVISEKITLNRFSLSTRKLSKNFFIQVIKYLEYCWRVLFFYRKKNIKVVNVHSLGLLPLGYALKKFYKARLVYDAHELETETNASKGFRQKFSKWLEKKLIHKADMTLVVSESIADWYANEYKIARPPVVFNAPNTRELKTNNHFREQLGIRDDQIILLYQGGLMPGRGVHLILDAFKQRKNDKVVAVFMGYGELETAITQAAAEHNTVFFFPAVAAQVVLEYTASADMGIHLIQNTCLNHDYCMPNKLFEYAMAGLPVLVSNMKDMSELVTRYAMGAVISDFSAAGINQAVDNFLEQDLTDMKVNAYQAAYENAWEVQEQKMLAAYTEMFLQKGLN